MLEQLVERLRPMLVNPNALVFFDGVIYLYTKDCELIAFDIGATP